MADKNFTAPPRFTALETTKRTTGEATSGLLGLRKADKDGRTPLHKAAQSGSENAYLAISELIDEGADVKAVDKDGQTPLHKATQSGSENAYLTIRELIKNGADVKVADKDGRTPLHEAARSGSENVHYAITQLVRHGADVKAADKDGRTPLHDAARSGSENVCLVISKLMNKGADVKAVDKDGRTPLHEAARSGSENVDYAIKLLVRHGADVKAVEKDGGTMLHEAARSGSRYAYLAISWLIDEGADVMAVDKDSRTPLHEAARSGSKNAYLATRVLIDKGVDVNAVDKDGQTPLHEAARSGSENVYRTVTELVRCGADLKAADKDGRTPLHEAARSGSKNTYLAISELIDEGADVEAAGKDGATKPYSSSRTSLQSIVRFLGFEEESPESAVVTASCYGKKEDAILLLQLGVDPIHVSKEWHLKYSTDAERKMPPHLQIWENSVTKHDYGTIRELINGITADDDVSFDSITWEWNLPAILASNVDNDVVLMCTNLRTELVGKSGRVHAMTYQEHLAQYKWADFIRDLLDLLKEAKLDSAHDGFSVCATRVPLVVITCSHANLSIHLDSKQACLAVFDLIEVLDWLCKTMSAPSIKDGHLISSAAYHLEHYVITDDSRHGLSRRSTVELHALRPSVSLKTSSLPEFEHNCWLSLFDACVVVDFPLASRGEFGKGLELSFDLMIALAAAEICLNINGGLVFVGYQTVLYPVATDGDCAQFHLITITDGQINPYTLDLKNVLRTDDSFQFKKMRCFVGWCEVAHINLGTRQLHANIGYSGGRNQSRSLEPDGYALLGQVGASAPLSAIMGLQKNFRYTRHRIRFTPTGNYLKLLHDTSRQSVVLYDATQHRCWLVPKLSVLLHMSQIYASHCAAVPNDQIPYVEPHIDAREIVTALESAGEKCILEGQTNKLLFRELMFALSINLLNTAEAVKESDGRKLYGFEFMDVVHEPGKGTCMKKLNIQSKRKDWLELVNAVGTVIVCSQLGEVISAAKGSTRKSPKCNELPQSHDYLAATLPCLSRLAEQKGVDISAGSDHIRLSDTAVWRLTQSPFTPCPHEAASHETCWKRPGLLQQVARQRRFSVLTVQGSSRTQSAQLIPINGAVVFG